MADTDWPDRGPLPLEPSVDEWRALASRLEAFLADKLEGLADAPSMVPYEGATNVDPADLEAWLEALFAPGFNPAVGGFMAYIPGGGLVTSALADWVIKTLNRYGTANFASPGLGDLENKVVNTFSRWVGYGDRAAGVLTTGGSLANFTALVTARRAKLPENFLDGVMYCSDQTHHSVMKAANLAGFSARNIAVIPSDDAFRLRTEALVERIEQDRTAGLTPFLVIASAGTTNTGSVDPLDAVAEICQQRELWYHVDAAYGGAFLLTERGRAMFAGIAHADSVTLDPHKGLFLPYGTGGLVVKDRDALVAAHELRGDYMPDLDRERAHLDPLSLSVELSREHRGLKVALPLVLHGEAAFRDALDEKLDLANYLYDELSRWREIELLHRPDLTTIAFRVADAKDRDAATRGLMAAVNESLRTYLSGTILNGEFALRVSILSHRTHREDVDVLIAALRQGLS